MLNSKLKKEIIK